MSDCEENELFWESWISPVKRKRKKNSQKDSKNHKTMKTDEKIQKKKKKKNSKSKDATVRKKAKKGAKKKKKNRWEMDNNFTLTEDSREPTEPDLKPETLNDKVKSDHMTQGCKKKKNVVFDLPGHSHVKHKFVSLTPHCPKKSVLSESEGHTEGCSQVTASGQSQGSTHNNDSQCTSEDMNSQDLFITQKTFRESPNELSSGEVVTESPQVLTLQDKQHSSVARRRQHLDESYQGPRDSHLHQHHRKSDEHEKKPETVQVLLIEGEEDDERSSKEHHKHKKAKYQTQMEFKANLTEKKLLCPLQVTAKFNPYLAEPLVVSPSLDVVKLKKPSCASSQQSMKSTSTQTENFFSTKLSSYLNFCQKTAVTTYCEDLKPLDLSLPQRARKDLWTCLSLQKSSLPNAHKNPDVQCASCSSGIKDVEAKKAASGRHSWSASTQGKRETTQSLQSESEPKSADTTTSSEDNEPSCRTGKPDLSQVRAVQMRLNESFFFKAKGEGQIPRPQSPLMKLTQSRDKKSRKGH